MTMANAKKSAGKKKAKLSDLKKKAKIKDLPMTKRELAAEEDVIVKGGAADAYLRPMKRV
jgi:hypothetical protein